MEMQQRFIDDVTHAVETDARVLAAWLEGSYGRGDADRFSDVDLHLLLAPATLTPAAADDPLLGALPGEFATMNGHFQAVLALPPQATLLAATQRDPHHAYRIGRCAWGIQWHPELDADVLAEYVARERAELTAAEVDVDATLAALAPTPVARSVLPRFVEVARAALADRAQVTQQAA